MTTKNKLSERLDNWLKPVKEKLKRLTVISLLYLLIYLIIYLLLIYIFTHYLTISVFIISIVITVLIHLLTKLPEKLFDMIPKKEKKVDEIH